jgi:hypothetical protein
MNKKDQTSTRVEMIRVSFQHNNIAQTKKVIHEWSIRDLYDILGLVEVSDILGMEEGKLTHNQIELILDVLNDKANAHKDAIWTLINSIKIKAPEHLTEAEEINNGHTVRLVYKMFKEFPLKALNEIKKQDQEWKHFFKVEWPHLKKRYISR